MEVLPQQNVRHLAEKVVDEGVERITLWLRVYFLWHAFVCRLLWGLFAGRIGDLNGALLCLGNFELSLLSLIGNF